MAGLGRRREALAAFEEAEKVLRYNFLGLPYVDLWYYMGEVLADLGEYERALDKLVPYAMYQRNLPPRATGKILEVYVDLNHGTAGFEEFLREARFKYAKRMHNFELPDFSGKVHTFQELKGKATIISFFAPV